MKNNKSAHVILLTLIGFALSFGLNKLYFSDCYHYLLGVVGIKEISFVITYLLIGIPIFLALFYMGGRNKMMSLLGLKSNLLFGFIFGLMATAPMWIGYGLSFKFNSDLTWTGIFIGSICAAFFEELYYRGFLFGLLYRYTGLGFVPSILLGALVFGSVHIYQSEDVATMIGIFFTTFMGAGLFAWLYVEWKFNLWVPIFLHLFMNLSWDMFDVSGNALGGLNANIFRIATIALVVTGTVIYKLRNGGLEVNKSTIWMKKMVS